MRRFFDFLFTQVEKDFTDFLKMNKIILSLLVTFGLLALVHSASIDHSSSSESVEAEAAPVPVDSPQDDETWDDWDEEIEVPETRGGNRGMCGGSRCRRGFYCSKKCKSKCVKSDQEDECPSIKDIWKNHNDTEGSFCYHSCNCQADLTCDMMTNRCTAKPATESPMDPVVDPIVSSPMVPPVVSENAPDSSSGGGDQAGDGQQPPASLNTVSNIQGNFGSYQEMTAQKPLKPIMP